MKVTVAGLFVFAAAALAQTVEYDFLYARDALMDSDDMFDDHEFWARDADADLEDWMEDILETREASSEDDGAITTILWSREAKKHAKDDWTPPKVNIPPQDKVLKNTFKCNNKKHTCSGEIQLQAPGQRR